MTSPVKLPSNDCARIAAPARATTSPGHDTTSATLAGRVDALLDHPDQLRALEADPSLVPNAVDETIRWVTPVRHFLRRAQQDYTLRGTRSTSSRRSSAA